ncbi:MAG: hypothetical protein M3157_00425 [Actinomycetota bacterium]|nr:hypothetical protein [Actinomycetota bacterium]
MTASAGPALKQLHEEFGDRVAFVSMYVREAHPGENYPQAEIFEEKLEHARAYKERDGIPWPVSVDDVEGSLHRTLDPKPHAAYIMNVRGGVAFRTLWANDERTLREGLKEISAHPEATVGERQPRAAPMLKGMGKFYEILGASGDVARRDLLREVPPMYAVARLANLFHPLPPLGRGVAAMATVAAGLTMLSVGLWRLVAR